MQFPFITYGMVRAIYKRQYRPTDKTLTVSKCMCVCVSESGILAFLHS